MAQRRSDILRRVGRRLRELRDAAGRTQEEVAERAGYTGKYVSEIERGLRDPPLSTLERIAVSGLGCSFDELLRGTAESPGAKALPREPLPRSLRQVVDDLAALPDSGRRKALPLVRGIIALARAAPR